MTNCITWVGMDDSASKINVAVFMGQESISHAEFVVENNQSGHGRLIKKLKSLPGEVRCVYEAGINGYHLQRVLSRNGIACDVAAPSLTPRRPGNRVKTDPRDAKDLAKTVSVGGTDFDCNSRDKSGKPAGSYAGSRRCPGGSAACASSAEPIPGATRLEILVGQGVDGRTPEVDKRDSLRRPASSDGA